jgi:hypothetical protein
MTRVLLLLPLLAAGCSSIRTSTDFDPAADFTRLKTWAFFPSRSAAPADARVSSLVDARIRAAVEAELGERGYTQVKESPDFYVAHQTAVGQRVEVDPNTVVVGYGWNRGSVGVANSNVRVYDEGTLVVDVIEPKANKLLWRGVAKGTVHENASPEDREARIRDAVKQLIDQFPPHRD